MFFLEGQTETYLFTARDEPKEKRRLWPKRLAELLALPINRPADTCVRLLDLDLFDGVLLDLGESYR